MFSFHCSCAVGCSLCLVRRTGRFGHLEAPQKAIIRRCQPRCHVSDGGRQEAEKDICVRMLNECFYDKPFFIDAVLFLYGMY